MAACGGVVLLAVICRRRLARLVKIRSKPNRPNRTTASAPNEMEMHIVTTKPNMVGSTEKQNSEIYPTMPEAWRRALDDNATTPQ